MDHSENMIKLQWILAPGGRQMNGEKTDRNRQAESKTMNVIT